MIVTYPDLLHTHSSPSVCVSFKSSDARKLVLFVRHAPSLAARQDFRGKSQEPGQQINATLLVECEHVQKYPKYFAIK